MLLSLSGIPVSKPNKLKQKASTEQKRRNKPFPSVSHSRERAQKSMSVRGKMQQIVYTTANYSKLSQLQMKCQKKSREKGKNVYKIKIRRHHAGSQPQNTECGDSVSNPGQGWMCARYCKELSLRRCSAPPHLLISPKQSDTH